MHCFFKSMYQFLKSMYRFEELFLQFVSIGGEPHYSILFLGKSI